MSPSNHPQQARLSVMLTELRMPTVKRLMPDLCAQSDREGWPAMRVNVGVNLTHLRPSATE